MTRWFTMLPATKMGTWFAVGFAPGWESEINESQENNQPGAGSCLWPQLGGGGGGGAVQGEGEKVKALESERLGFL